MNVADIFQTLGIALGLGLLVGIQRERVAAPLAGMRTFALITLLGALMGLLAPAFGPWVVAAGLLAVAATTAVGNLAFASRDRSDSGITTEIAVLFMYGVGAYLAVGPREVAVVLGAGVAVLLHAKPVMRDFVQRLGETDMRVMMQFVLISLVILPVLPDRAYGPFQVLNPREIWWMVVLVVGIGSAGYIALKLYGARTGIVFAGLIGGLISSTATTVSYGRRTGQAEGAAAAATLVIVLASTVVYARVLAEMFVVGRRVFAQIAPPIVVLLVTAAVLCVVVWRRAHRAGVELPPLQNPTGLRPALVFGALYAIVLVSSVAARHAFGDRGIYIAAAVSGLTDLDAITLTASRLSAGGLLSPGTGWRAVVLALMCNLAFKTVVVAALGGVDLARRFGALFAIQIGVGAALLAFWPG